MKTKILVFVIIIFSAMPLLPQTEHIQKFIKCGMPGLSDYKCFDNDTVRALNPIELDTAENYNTGEIPNRFMARMLLMRTSAYLVIKDNKVLYEQYWFGFDKDSVMNSFSVAKSIVALLVGVAIKEGKIQSINQYVCDFLPQYTQLTNSELRIVDLLSMGSGSGWSEDFANPMSDIAIAYYGTSLDSLMENYKIVDKPGTNWKYQCGNTVLLSLVLEAATGEPIYKYAEEKLWTPLGATHDAMWGKDKPDGMTKAFCCFYATPRDFAKLGLLVLNQGYYNGQQIVSKEYIQAVTSPATWLKHRKKPVDFYGLHFWLVEHKKEQIPYFSGMFGQYIFVMPNENAVVVRFGEMLNELSIQPLPPDVPLYLKASDRILK